MIWNTAKYALLIILCSFSRFLLIGAMSEEYAQRERAQAALCEIIRPWFDVYGNLPGLGTEIRMHPRSERMLEIHEGNGEQRSIEKLGDQPSQFMKVKFLVKATTLHESVAGVLISQLLPALNMMRKAFFLAPLGSLHEYPGFEALQELCMDDISRIFVEGFFVTMCASNRVTEAQVSAQFAQPAMQQFVDKFTENKYKAYVARFKNRSERMFRRFIRTKTAADSCVDQMGRTALMFCAMMGNIERAKWLCAIGACATKKDLTYKSAIEYAQAYGHHAIVAYLKEHADERSSFKKIWCNATTALDQNTAGLIFEYVYGAEKLMTIEDREELERRMCGSLFKRSFRVAEFMLST